MGRGASIVTCSTFWARKRSNEERKDHERERVGAKVAGAVASQYVYVVQDSISKLHGPVGQHHPQVEVVNELCCGTKPSGEGGGAAQRDAGAEKVQQQRRVSAAWTCARATARCRVGTKAVHLLGGINGSGRRVGPNKTRAKPRRGRVHDSAVRQCRIRGQTEVVSGRRRAVSEVPAQKTMEGRRAIGPRTARCRGCRLACRSPREGPESHS